MPWTIFPKGISDLPHVLAGPIVRMVTVNKVIIWVCTQNNSSIKLEIRDVNQNVIASSGFDNPIKLGDNLFVAALIVDNLTLSSNTKYYYQMVFSINGDMKALGDPGILNTKTDRNGVLRTQGAIEKITFQTTLAPTYEPLPSFITPPSDINELRFLHASCRKPHGNNVNRLNVDGLYGTYKTLGLHFLNPSLINRPHQLFLTGDQLYGDDVSDELLYYITNAANEIVGNYAEPFSSATTPIVNGLWALFYPGYRSALRPYTNLSSEDDKSHLIYLKEFFVAYLFFWSDTLYPSVNSITTLDDNLPSLYDVYGGPGEIARPFEPERQGLINFQATLPAVRRGLANISTYMVFDDHEVTDDLFLNLNWCYKVLGYDGSDAQFQSQLNSVYPENSGSEFGQRVITNGMVAFNVFQLLGNYDLRSNGDFAQFKTSLANVVNNPTNLQHWDSLKSEVLPKLAKSNPSIHCDAELVSKDYWNFQLDFGIYQVVFLNSRTQRGFIYDKNGSNAAQLICWNKVQQQLGQYLTPGLPYSFSIIIAPSPVIGYMPSERGKVFGKEKFQKTEEFMDFEDWENNRKLKEYILEKIAQVPRVIVLSGDVHYSFSNVINYWDNRVGFSASLEKRSTIVQLTSSPLKNEKSEGFFYFVPGTTEVENSWFLNSKFAQSEYEIVGWKQDGGHVKKYVVPRINSSQAPKWLPLQLYSDRMSPVLHDITPGTILTDKINDPPDWSYRIRSVGDIRTSSQRSTDILASGLYPGSSSYIKEQYSLIHRRRLHVDNHFFVPGRNNIALISVSGFPNAPQIIQEFFYSPAQDKQIDIYNNYGTDYFQMLTRHVIDFKIEDYNSLSAFPNNRPGY